MYIYFWEWESSGQWEWEWEWKWEWRSVSVGESKLLNFIYFIYLALEVLVRLEEIG